MGYCSSKRKFVKALKVLESSGYMMRWEEDEMSGAELEVRFPWMGIVRWESLRLWRIPAPAPPPQNSPIQHHTKYKVAFRRSPVRALHSPGYRHPHFAPVSPPSSHQAMPKYFVATWQPFAGSYPPLLNRTYLSNFPPKAAHLARVTQPRSQFRHQNRTRSRTCCCIPA